MSAASQRDVPLETLGGEHEPQKSVGSEGLATPRRAVEVKEGLVPKAKTAADHALLYGRITNELGDPLDGVLTHVTLPTGEQASTRSDADGRYALGPLPVGRYLLTTYKMFYHTANAEVILNANEEGFRYDPVLKGQQIVRVRIATSEGVPAAPLLTGVVPRNRLALVPVATRQDPGHVFNEVMGSLNNTFGIGVYGRPGYFAPERMFPDEYGSVTLQEDGPAWISLIASHQVIAKQRIQPEDEVVLFTVDPADIEALFATVRATVLDAETAGPVPARAFLGENPFYNSEARFEVQVRTGALLLERQLPGQRWLIVEAEGWAPIRRRIDVPRGGTLELGTLVMHRPVSISGTVTNAEGQVLEAVVEWGVLDDGTGRVDWAARTGTTSDASGRYRIDHLEPGVYLVRVPGLPARSPRPHDASMASLPVRVDVRARSVEGVEMSIGKTTRLTLATGTSEPPFARARVLDSKGLPARASWLGRWGAEAGLDLVPGSYTLVVTREDEELLRRPLEIGDKPLRLELEL